MSYYALWIITQRGVVITYRSFGTTFRSHLVTATDGAVYCAYGGEREVSMTRLKLGHPTRSHSQGGAPTQPPP